MGALVSSESGDVVDRSLYDKCVAQKNKLEAQLRNNAGVTADNVVSDDQIRSLGMQSIAKFKSNRVDFDKQRSQKFNSSVINRFLDFKKKVETIEGVPNSRGKELDDWMREISDFLRENPEKFTDEFWLDPLFVMYRRYYDLGSSRSSGEYLSDLQDIYIYLYEKYVIPANVAVGKHRDLNTTHSLMPIIDLPGGGRLGDLAIAMMIDDLIRHSRFDKTNDQVEFSRQISRWRAGEIDNVQMVFLKNKFIEQYAYTGEGAGKYDPFLKKIRPMAEKTFFNTANNDPFMTSYSVQKLGGQGTISGGNVKIMISITLFRFILAFVIILLVVIIIYLIFIKKESKV